LKVTESTDDQLMCLAAHRYCLGRSSYIVSSCLAWLVATWGDFTANTRNVIVRDTIESLMDGNAGMTMDVEGWLSFAEWAWLRLDGPGRVWVFQAVAHKRKPWPLSESTATPTEAHP
jgi:hypothetical protein